MLLAAFVLENSSAPKTSQIGPKETVILNLKGKKEPNVMFSFLLRI